MQITQASDYAMRAVFNLARRKPGSIVDAKVISEEENIPLRFLLKIFRSLIQAGIVKSYRGVNGGYALLIEPKDISMLQVVEAVEGPIRLNKCLVSPEQCSLHTNSKECCFHAAWAEIQKDTIQKMKEYTFDKFLESEQQK